MKAPINLNACQSSAGVDYSNESHGPGEVYYRHPMDDIEPEDERMISEADAAKAIRVLLARIISSNDPVLECKLIALSVGISFDEKTMTELAQKYGVSREAVSKRQRDLQDEFGIKSSGFNKRSGSRKTYKLTNVRRKKLETV